jgi:hypothetical protein
VHVVPNPPQVPMMHLLLRTTPERFAAAARALAADQGIWTWPAAVPTVDPAVQRLELTVGDGTLGFAPDEVRDVLAALAA